MKTSNPPIQTLAVRPYSNKELRMMYEVSRRTMTSWLRPHLPKIGKREGRYWTVKQVSIIFDVLGLPPCFDTP